MSREPGDLAASKALTGQRVLITGGAKRIGRAIALDLAAAGARVAITYRESKFEADQTVADLAAEGSDAFAVKCDVSDEASVNAAVAEVVQKMHGLDLLINNAGAFETAPLEQITAEQWDAMFATNTRGPFLVAKAAHGALAAGSGRIVNIGSLGGLHPWPTHAHYCTSKAALHMLSQTMAKAWAPEISVNCVAPGMIAIGATDAAYEHLAAKTPMKRNGTPADVAAAVLFFATAPHFITGQLLAVDGGLAL
ncbi:3-oxoacyl-[acyl-carrier protein] reductase/pteridine reductase [Bryocella elongata]|uniref:3-oxoacyl-[acyl-carrier protein] reductase/pteridine reductase n=1 Tax=Bryocella elongata TaxID=863522 RepID=A0A1H5Z6C5_9BACT|nr:SDR family NAD(P)-dependent oxidoreductase [Bryocella elongata]SEG31911.1 3-oxoacyl-[acyl-carrier protein] reductase/pteridine reductase [Bryocella elongata]